MKKSLFAALFAVLMSACSIKENRSDCPCYLTLDFSEVDCEKISSARLDLHSADSFNQTIELGSETLGKTMVLEVPRTELFVNVIAGDGGYFSPDLGLTIPFGEACPPVYMHSSMVDTRHDSARDTVRLFKNYSILTVGMLSDGISRPFDVGIKGNVCGYTLAGRPKEGEFIVIGTIPAAERACVNLPRQDDSSLSLQILEDGEIVREFALGEYIAASGFDWTAPDLEDIDVVVDFALCEISIKIEEWETRYVYGVEI